MERLWEEFKLKASADARERLILHCAPLVRYVAGRVSVGLPPESRVCQMHQGGAPAPGEDAGRLLARPSELVVHILVGDGPPALANR